MKSQICELLNIEFPMVAFSHCRDVVAAVSKAGGMGVLGAVGLSPEKVRQLLKLPYLQLLKQQQQHLYND